MVVEGTHIKFVPAPPKPKTKVWWVVNKHDDIHLGWIGWFGRWRKYAFYPKEETVYGVVSGSWLGYSSSCCQGKSCSYA